MKTVKRVLCIAMSLLLLSLTACSGNEKGNETTDPGDVVATDDVTDEQATSGESTDSTDIENKNGNTTASDVTEEVKTEATESSVTEKATTPSEQPTKRPSETENKPTEPPVTEAHVSAETDGNKKYTKAEIVDILKTAVNRTKGFTGDITVHHKESFADLKISNVSPGGAITSRLMNFVTGLVIKPSEEDYSFSNGTAKTSEGETTQLLLPKDAAFTLTEKGVKNATLEKKNGMTHIVVTLVDEECNSLTEKPKHNASSIGYLDISDSFKVMKITTIKIKYPGSVIDAYIRDDGYVSSVSYTINMDCHGEASYGLIDGKADFKGAQTEVWTINW